MYACIQKKFCTKVLFGIFWYLQHTKTESYPL